MKLKAFIKLILKQLVKDFHICFFSFVIFPLMVSMLYGYFQRNLFSPSNEISKVSIFVRDEDSSKSSKELINFLAGNNLKQIIDFKDSNEKSSLQLVIPKGYEDALLSLKEFNIKIELKDKDSKSKAKIVSLIIDKYNENLQQHLVITNSIAAKDLSKDEREQLSEKILSEVSEVCNTDSIKNEIIKKDKDLTSYEYYSISLLSFMFMVSAMSLALCHFTEKENGLLKRELSTPLTKVEFFHYSLISYFIYALILNAMYVFSYRIIGFSFKGSIFLLLIIVVFNSLLEVALVGFIMAFFKNKKYATIFYQILAMFSVSIGGVFFPAYKVIDNKAFQIIYALCPNTLLIGIYKNFLIYNTFDSIKFYLLLFILLSLVFYVISFIKIKVKWED